MSSAISDLSGLFGGSSSNTQSSAVPGVGDGTGSNQYMSYPNTPGIVPVSQPLSGSGSPSYNTGAYYASGGNVPGTNSIHMAPTMDPTLTNQFYSMLSGEVGKGVSPFNLSSSLPSSGQATDPGQLSAPMNQIMQQLMQFYGGGQSSIPGSSQLSQMAQTGNPIDQTPAWQAMIAAQQQNTDVNAANLREQFAFGGDLKSSPFGNSMQQFYNQNTLNQNAQLTQAQATAQENAQNRELQAQQGIMGGGQQFGNDVQSLDQNAINAMYQEFIRTSPEYNPMNQTMAQSANQIAGVAGQTPTTMQNISGLISSLSGLV